ncbi:MAG: sugar transferase, partial [bacterium]
IFTEFNGTDIAILKEKVLGHLSSAIHESVLREIKISCHVYPESRKKMNSAQTERDPLLYPDLTTRNYKKKAAAILKRAIDVIGGICGIILFLPFFLVIPVLIKLTSPGPVFFRQARVGQFGRKFTFLKFRTMHVNCDEALHKKYIQELIGDKKSREVNNNGKRECVYKIYNDPRVTRIGSFLRKSSLDEIPQFLNVIRGDMSIVGPRPPIPYELENYDIWHMRRILEMKPGITGVWQVYGRSKTNFDEMVRMDIMYTKQWSLLLDIKLIMRTPLAVISGKGAY